MHVGLLLAELLAVLSSRELPTLGGRVPLVLVRCRGLGFVGVLDTPPALHQRRDQRRDHMSRHSNSCFLCLGQLSVDEFQDELTLLIAAFGPLPEAAVNECGDSSKVLFVLGIDHRCC